MSQLINIFNEAIEILNSVDFKSDFASSVEWIEKNKALWENGKIYIGLIGVTSTGKSTLINALIGEKLLPSGTQPTTNMLAQIQHGDKKYAEVIFKEQNKAKIKFRKNIAENLKKYGDEEENKGNIMGVKEIHIYSPEFKLPKNVVLMDTPGLGAYKLDDHEKLTFDSYLPTIDLVIYLTTTTVSSDNENLKFLEKIIKKNKPLIIAQNKIDGVLEKTTTNKITGREEIEKDKNAVIREHYKRVQNILDHSKNKSLKYARIVQLSAFWALQEPENPQSNFDAFIKAVNDEKENLTPTFDAQRARQLHKHLTNLVDNNKEINYKKKMVLDIKKRERELSTLKNDISSSEEKLNDSLGELESLTNDFFQNCKAFEQNCHSMEDDDIKQFYIVFQNCIDNLNIQIKNFHKESDKYCSKYSNLLNLNLTDINHAVHSSFEMPDLPTTPPATTVERTEVIEGGILRKALHYVTCKWVKKNTVKTYTVEVVDKENVRVIIRKYDNFSDILSNFSNRYILFGKDFHEELERRDKELESNKISDFDIDQIKEIERALEGLNKTINKIDISYPIKKYTRDSITKTNDPEFYLSDERIENMEISTILQDLLAIASSINQAYFHGQRDYCLSLSGKKIKKILIMGWDYNYINYFCRRFFSDLDKVKDLWHKDFSQIELDEDIHCHKLKTDRWSFIIIDCSKHKSEEYINEIDADTHVFLLLNTPQTGIAKSKLNKLNCVINPEISLTVVYEDFQVFLSQDSTGHEELYGAYLSMKSIIEECRLNPNSAIVNHDQFVFSILFNELHKQENILKTKVDHKIFIESLTKACMFSNDKEKDQIAGILNNYIRYGE